VRIRKFVTTCEDIREENGREVGRLVRRAVCSAVIDNPLAGKPGADLAVLEAMGAEISGQLAERALAALGVAAGEIEHAAALIHPRFGAPVRKTVVKGDDIIPSTKKIGGPGAHITLPITNKDDIWSFNEMDAIDVWIPDAPHADEIVVSVALAVGGRPFARTKKPS
jgi:hypothetical protein